jgi:hypothetical protein
VFAEVVETSAKHVVEVNRQEAVEFREQVLKLAGHVSGSTAASDLEAARIAFRMELQEYSRKAAQHVHTLREELRAAATAMRTFAEGVSTSGNEHETVLKREFGQLERAAEADDVRAVRVSIHATVQLVTESYEELKRANALNIAQLRDEIRVLHGELQREHRKPGLPGGIPGEEVFDREIEELLRLDRPFAVVLIGIANRQGLYERFPQGRVDAAIATLLAEAAAMARQIAPQATIGARGMGTYAVTLPSSVPLGDWQTQLTQSHVFQVDGLPRTLRVSPRLDVVERACGESHAVFFGKLSQAAGRIAQERT